MFFESYKSIIYSDTLLPDIFISEYLPSMNPENIKVYIYCLFLSKHGKKATAEELSKKLEMEVDKVKDALTNLENLGIITRKDKNIQFIDLKEKEINKIYRVKTTSTPEEAVHSTERNKKRNRIISAINNTFFQGVMSPSWYTDIDSWFDKYNFEEDVMYALFQHCYDHNGLAKQYIAKVADNWHHRGIKNSFDLDAYFIEYQKVKDIKMKIVKKLKRKAPLTEYDEEYIEKWVLNYNYNFDIIELALKKTTAIANPNFQYINSILTSWYNQGLKDKEEITSVEANKKQKAVKPSSKQVSIPQHDNFEQRKYDKDYFNNVFEDV